MFVKLMNELARSRARPYKPALPSFREIIIIFVFREMKAKNCFGDLGKIVKILKLFSRSCANRQNNFFCVLRNKRTIELKVTRWDNLSRYELQNVLHGTL